MSESSMEELGQEFNLREVGSFVVDAVDKFEHLNTGEKDGGKVFLEILSKSLSTCRVSKNEHSGGNYIDMYQPQFEGSELPVAIKVFPREGKSNSSLRVNKMAKRG